MLGAHCISDTVLCLTLDILSPLIIALTLQSNCYSLLYR